MKTQVDKKKKEKNIGGKKMKGAKRIRGKEKKRLGKDEMTKIKKPR